MIGARSRAAMAALLALAACDRPGTGPIRQADGQARMADIPPCESFFRIDPAADLSLAEALKLAAPEAIVLAPARKGGAARELVYAAFDYEDRPQRGDNLGFGVVFARDVRPGARPVGGVIWTDAGVMTPSDGGYRLDRQNDGVRLLLHPADSESMTRPGDPPPVCRGYYVVRLDRSGDLFAGGVRIGGLGD